MPQRALLSVTLADGARAFINDRELAGEWLHQSVEQQLTAPTPKECMEDSSDADLGKVDDLLVDLLSLQVPGLRAQQLAARAVGHNVHSSRSLVPDSTRFLANVARHGGFQLSKPIADMSMKQLEQEQRGGPLKGGRRGTEVNGDVVYFGEVGIDAGTQAGAAHDSGGTDAGTQVAVAQASIGVTADASEPEAAEISPAPSFPAVPAFPFLVGDEAGVSSSSPKQPSTLSQAQRCESAVPPTESGKVVASLSPTIGLLVKQPVKLEAMLADIDPGVCAEIRRLLLEARSVSQGTDALSDDEFIPAYVQELGVSPDSAKSVTSILPALGRCVSAFSC